MLRRRFAAPLALVAVLAAGAGCVATAQTLRDRLADLNLRETALNAEQGLALLTRLRRNRNHTI